MSYNYKGALIELDLFNKCAAQFRNVDRIGCRGRCMSEICMPCRKCEKSEVPQQVEVTGVKIEKNEENNSDYGYSIIKCHFDYSGCCAGAKEKRSRGSSKKK